MVWKLRRYSGTEKYIFRGEMRTGQYADKNDPQKRKE